MKHIIPKYIMRKYSKNYSSIIGPPEWLTLPEREKPVIKSPPWI
jgi:hypothetical protein